MVGHGNISASRLRRESNADVPVWADHEHVSPACERNTDRQTHRFCLNSVPEHSKKCYPLSGSLSLSLALSLSRALALCQCSFSRRLLKMHLSLKSWALIQSSRLSVTAACVDSLLTEGSLAVAAALQHRSSSIATATIQHTQAWWETSSSPRSSGKPAANCAQRWYVYT
jgi:hypothetical protein